MWRKIGCIALIVLVLAIAAAVIYQQQKGEGGFKFGKQSKTDEEKESYFAEAKLGNLELVVEATGETEPITDIDVMSEATGRIIEFYVEEGDYLQEGDLICKLDQSNQLLAVQQRRIALDQAELAYNLAKDSTSTTQRSSLVTAVESAEAQLRSAKEALENAQATYGRIQAMHGKGFATDQELENARQSVVSAESSLASAEASRANSRKQLDAFEGQANDSSIKQAQLAVNSARVALQEAEKQLGDSVIKSPIEGIILEKRLDVGDSVVSINSAFGSSTSIVRVADMTKLKIRTSVDEIDIGKIEVGQPSTFTVDTYPEREFEGVVTNKFPQGVQSGTGLVNFIVIIEADNSENLLLGKMTTNVKIQTQKIENVLLVPLASTRAGDEPDTDIVYVLKEGGDEFDKDAETEERVVKLGDTDYYDIVVVEGLEEGEKVKIRGFDMQIRFE